MIYAEYCQDVLFAHYNQKISRLMQIGQKEATQNEAFEWLQEYANKLCVSIHWNWKLAKKQIAAFYFGEPPSVRLFYQDSIDKGIEFITNNAKDSLRCSYHKYDTACHSESRRISLDSIGWLKEIKMNMSERDIIDIFTECSTKTSTCFRRFSLQYNEEIAYEMGYGQAMYVFETQRGQHDVASISIYNGIKKLNISSDPQLMNHLEMLIDNHEDYFAIKTHTLCYVMGVPQVSIEGYFDTSNPTKAPIIVDIDLPFDKAFF